MTDHRSDWTRSPNAAEFLPDEIAQLNSGAMTICDQCQWPHASGEPCDKCPTYNHPQDSKRRPPGPRHSHPAGTAQ